MSQHEMARPGIAGLARALCLAGAIGFSAAVSAEEPTKEGERSATKGDKSLKLSPVVVTATRVEENSFDLPLAIDVVSQDSIRAGKLEVNVSEVLNQVPGTNVQNRENFAQELQISIRGFGARSQFGTRGVKLFSDGIPLSTPDGQGGPGGIDLGSAQRIEVLRGAFSALYGNHSGGVVQAFTADGPPNPTLGASFSMGSYDTWRAGMNFGGQSGSLNYTGNYNHFETDGYREHSAAEKQSFNGKATYGYGGGSSLSLVAGWYDVPLAEDPLGLDAQQVAQNRRQAILSAYQFNTRRSLDNTQIGAVIEHNFSDRDQVRGLAYLGNRGNEQYLPFTGNFGLSSGGVSTIDRDFGGVNLRWTHRDTLGETPMTFTAGVDYDKADDDRKGYVNDFGVRGALRRDEDNTVDSWGAYAQGQWELTPQWSAFAGLRYTKVSFESSDRFITATNPNDSGSQDYDDWTPVAGLLWKAAPTLNLYANYGRSFETPTFIELAYRPDGLSGLNFGLQPSTSDQYEIGAKAFIGPNARVNAALFYIDTENEIVIATNQAGRSTFQNAPGSERLGLELSFEGDLGRGLTGYVAYTYLNAEYSESFRTCTATPCNTITGVNTALVPSDSRIPGISRYSAYGELTWRYAPLGFTTAVEGVWNGKVAVNDLNSEFAGSYALLNWWAGFEQRVGRWRFKEFARVNNVFDRKYIGAVIVGDLNGRYYAPAPERNYLVGVNASYAF